MTASAGKRFALDPAVASVVRAASTARAAGARWFIMAGLLYVWIGASNRVWAAAIVGLQLTMFSTVARWTTRVPRSAGRADYDDRALTLIARTMGVPVPTVQLARRNPESVRVRGSSLQPAILISPKSLLVWKHDPATHSVQLSHEMGHIWARDLTRARFLTIGVLFVAAEVFAITATRQHEYTLVLLGIATALVSLRSFLRAREHAADFIAARILGSQARDQLATARAPEGRLPLLLRTHPTAEQRRRAFNEPSELFSGYRLPMFAVGFSCTFALDMGTAAYRTLTADGTWVLHILLVPWALALFPTLGGLVATSALLTDRRTIKSWMRSYLFGTLACLFALTGVDIASAVVVVYLGAALAIAWLIAPIPELLVAIARNPNNLVTPVHQISQAICPVAAWVTLLELYYFRALGPIVHLVARLPLLS